MADGHSITKQDKTCDCGAEMKITGADFDAVVMECPDCGLKRVVPFKK